MKQFWDPGQWKRSKRLLLGLGTLWPYIYAVIFVVGLIAASYFAKSSQQQKPGYCGMINLTQLKEKINAGQVDELVFTSTEIISTNRTRTCEYHTPNRDGPSQDEIRRLAHDVDASGKQRVAKIDQAVKPPVSTGAIIGFIAVVIVHFLTIVWVILLAVFYAILAAKNEQFDQTTKIIWIVGLCMLTMIVMPVYWYLYVWRKREATTEVHPIT